MGEIIGNPATKMKLSVTGFVKTYNAMNAPKAKEAFLGQTLKIASYVPYMEKVAMAEMVVKNSCLDGNGNVHVDSAKKYILYMVALLSAYTNMEIDGNNGAEEYDMLNSSGILGYILTTIPKGELEEFRTVVQMKYDDLITNSYEIHAFITKTISDIWALVSPFLNKGLDTLEKAVSNIDVGELEDAIKAMATMQQIK